MKPCLERRIGQGTKRCTVAIQMHRIGEPASAFGWRGIRKNPIKTSVKPVATPIPGWIRPHRVTGFASQTS